MPITVEATYEDGVLKPERPLPLSEREKVRVTITSAPQRPAVATGEGENAVRRSYGLLGWKGDAESVERIALDPEFDINEAP